MKSKITIAIIILFTLKINAQVNLITNGSFENFTGTCPTSSPNGAFIQEQGGWHPGNFISALGFIPSVDLYCGESNYGNCMPGPVPNVGSNGISYVGMHTRIYNPTYNESIYQILSTPLIAGDVYTISFDLMNCQSGLFTAGHSDYAVYTNSDTLIPACPKDNPAVNLVGFVPYDSISNISWKRHSFSFLAPPNSNIIAFSGDSCNVSEIYFYLDSVVLIHETTESIIEFANGFTFTVQPNPANDLLNIEYQATENKNTVIEIRNVLGQLIYSDKIMTSIGKQTQSINLTGIAEGVYFINVKNDKQNITKKFMKK